MLTILTCTGDRHHCFGLMERWLAAQTCDEPYQWIVIDDGASAANCTMGQTVIKIPTLPEGGKVHPMPAKLLIAIRSGLIKGDKILFMEDDDYYGPNYLQAYADFLDDFSIVGEGMARYYHAREKLWWRHGNRQHASLAQTGIRRDMLPLVEQAIEAKGDPFVDLRLWQLAGDQGHVFLDPGDQLAMFCGFKAMPGRGGVACGHDALRQGYKRDEGLRVLKQWCPKDWQEYAKL